MVVQTQIKYLSWSIGGNTMQYSASTLAPPAMTTPSIAYRLGEAIPG